MAQLFEFDSESISRRVSQGGCLTKSSSKVLAVLQFSTSWQHTLHDTKKELGETEQREFPEYLETFIRLPGASISWVDG
jgi:hypothetical protein